MAPSGRKGQKDTYLGLSPPVTSVASFLLCIYDEKVQHLEKIRLNMRLGLHTPPCPLLLMARKMPFFLKNFKRDGYLYYLYCFHSLHLANRQSQHTGSQLNREGEDCTCLIPSKHPGNGNCSAQPSALLSRSIWIFSSLSYELGTF